MTLGERIKEHRNRLGYSQEKLAELMDISRQAVTKWESGRSIPSMEHLMTLADIFGLSLGELSGTINKNSLNLRPVKSAWRIYGKITMLLGIGFIAAAIILLIIQSVGKVINFTSLPFILGVNGTAWLTLGIVFSAYARHEAVKLSLLKRDGLCYDAKIERIVRTHYWIRIGSILSGYAECSYLNQDSEKCLVKSKSFLLDEQMPDYIVSVYVSRADPADYAVEIFS